MWRSSRPFKSQQLAKIGPFSCTSRCRVMPAISSSGSRTTPTVRRSRSGSFCWTCCVPLLHLPSQPPPLLSSCCLSQRRRRQDLIARKRKAALIYIYKYQPGQPGRRLQLPSAAAAPGGGLAVRVGRVCVLVGQVGAPPNLSPRPCLHLGLAFRLLDMLQNSSSLLAHSSRQAAAILHASLS